MKNRLGKSFLTLSILSAALMTACGGGQPQSVSQSISDSPEPDFFGELSVDVKEVLPGTWTVQGYSIGEEDESVDVTSTITFAADGTIASFNSLPLFNYPEHTVETPFQNQTCERVVMPEGVVGRTAHGYSPYYTHLFLDASMHYEVIKTSFNPIIRFSIRGKKFSACCVEPRSRYSNNESGTESYNNQCTVLKTDGSRELISTELFDDSETSGYLVIGARENEIALVWQDMDYLVILKRVP